MASTTSRSPQGLLGAVAVLIGLGQAACGRDLSDVDDDCQAGDGEACYALALLYGDGERWGPTEDIDIGDARRDGFLGMRYAVVACEHAYAAGCNRAGRDYEQGVWTERDNQEALAHYGRACELGRGGSCLNAGELLFDEGSGETARPLLNRACHELDDGTSCYMLAAWYPASADERVALYERACQLDAQDGSGCWAAGALLANVEGERDHALELLRTACRRMGEMSTPCRDVARVESGQPLESQTVCGTTPDGQEICWETSIGSPWGNILP